MSAETGNTSLIKDALPLFKELLEHICVGIPNELEKSILLKTVADLRRGTPPVDVDEKNVSKNVERHLKHLRKNQNDILEFHSLLKVVKENHNTSSMNLKMLRLFLTLSELNHPEIQDQRTLIGRQISSNMESLRISNNIERSIPKSFSAHELLPSKKQSIMRPKSLHQSSFRETAGTYIPHEGISKSSSMQSNFDIKDSTSLSLMSASPYNLKVNRMVVSERKVVDDLLACFQGIASDTFKEDHERGYTLTTRLVPQISLVQRLMELGFLHNFIVDHNKILNKKGSVGRSIVSAIENELLDYLRVITLIHSEHVGSSRRADDTPMSDDDYSPVTIRRLLAMMQEYFYKFPVVADVLKLVIERRGGEMLIPLNVLRHHGNPTIAQIINNITSAGGRTIVNMIITWMVNGELYDRFDEFFITKDSSCHEKDIWRNMFVLRPSLIPTMIKPQQAELILNAGKAIHFLNVINNKQVPIEGLRAQLNNMRDCSIIDFSDKRSKINELIALIAEESSKQVLETVKYKFKLLQHFQGLRRYILLGQGDFVSYFMELVEPEMKQAASDVRYYDLMEKLQTAIRTTTAVREDPEIIKNVSIKLLVASAGDLGSDIFGLQYLMDEYLSAAFRLAEGGYSHLFNFLWRNKRMEYRLLLLTKERWGMRNCLNWLEKRFKDINTVMMVVDSLSQALLHFAHQFHYYILFEVVECLWQKFCQNYEKAKSFDDVIRAHESFIEEMHHKMFQTKSKSFINELRLIWDLLLEIEVLQNRFFKRAVAEHELWEKIEKDIEKSGTCNELELEIAQKQKEFKAFLFSIRAQYTILNRNYQEVVRRFLLELTSHKDYELMLLSERIDYNEFYKNMDARISECMKYSRCRDLFF